MDQRKPLTVAEEHELDIKKLLDDIDFLDVITDECDNRSVLEMFNVKNELQWLSDRELIGLSEFVRNNSRLEKIGEKFKKCYCHGGQFEKK